VSLPLTREPLFGVAGVQMSVSSIDDNVDRIGAYLRHIRVRFPWVRLVMFSELAPLGPKLAKAEPLPGPTETRLAALARETGLWLIPGSMFEKVVSSEGERVYNTTPVINPQGEVVARFRKLFPFRPYERDVAGGKDFWTASGVPLGGVAQCAGARQSIGIGRT